MFVFQHKGKPHVVAPKTQYAQERLPQQQNVSQSLPQGDPWCMAAMTAVLLVGVNAVQTEVPDAKCITYVDDRTILAPTAPKILRTCLVGSKKRKLTPAETKRLQKAVIR